MSETPDRIGDYRIEAELGAGGMATVYRARHVVLDTLHAIKVLDPAYRARPAARQRFLDEARIQAKHLDHPNIVKVTNIVATPEHAALVMELVDGGNLEGEVGRLKDRPDEIRRLMLAILDAVGHAHAAGIIHRDLKPANVLLARKDGQVIPKVTDFGIAKVTAELAGTGKRSTHGDARMGTLGYMSPEQVRRAKDVTVKSDVFSLGAMLYELATGEVPFGGDSDYDVMENVVNGRYPPPEAIHEGIDPGLAAVIRKALEVDPARRYASCAEMAAALRADVQLPPPPPPPPPPRRRALVLGGLAIAGVAFGAGALLVATRGKDTAGSGGNRTLAVSLDASSLAPATDAGWATPSTGPSGSRTVSYAEAAAAAMAAQDPTGPADAGVAAVPLFPVDAGRLASLHAGNEPPVDAGARSRLEALLGPLDAGPRPPPPNPCRGTWFFSGAQSQDWTVAVTGRSSGTCGEIYMYDRTVTSPGVRTCHSQLRSCTVSGRTLTATFGCSYNVRPAESRGGRVTLSCPGGRITVRTPYGTRTSN